jgi:hypothetical protein
MALYDDATLPPVASPFRRGRRSSVDCTRKQLLLDLLLEGFDKLLF